MNTHGGVFGQYSLYRRYNGQDICNFVPHQASSHYNYNLQRPQYGDHDGFNGYHHHHHHSRPPVTGLQFIADVAENGYHRHWDNGAIVQQPYFQHHDAINRAVAPNPFTMGPPAITSSAYNHTEQTATDFNYYQENWPGYANHMPGVNEDFTSDQWGDTLKPFEHSFDSRPEWLKRRDACVFCRLYDGKEPNEILFRVCM